MGNQAAKKSPLFFSKACFAPDLSVKQQLVALYALATFLCVFMVAWVLVLPAIVFVLTGKAYRQHIVEKGLDDTFPHLPPHLSGKFLGQTFIQMTHILPGGVWAAIVPFQLHPTWRLRHKRTHRILGYIFFATCILSIVGLVAIFSKKLSHEDYFPHLPPLKLWQSTFYGSIAIGSWFIYTAIMAIKSALQKQFHQHQRWIVRHVGAGLFVAVQRCFMFMISPFYLPPIYNGTVSEETRRSLFGDLARAAIFCTVALAEYAVILLDQQREIKRSS